MRIQDLPDELEIDTTRTAAIRQIGNAVPPTIGEVFGRAIAQAVGEEPRAKARPPKARAGARFKAAA
jgi:C-5 cytosine-specific DNA methylase